MTEAAPVPFRLNDKVVIVTGAGRGIGRAIATVFAHAGAQVVVATRTASSGQETVAAIREHGQNASLVAVDVGTREACAGLVEKTIAQHGKLDIVVHNAAVMSMSSIEEISDVDLVETMNVNLLAAFWLAKAAVPHLRKSTSPRLLFTSSVTGPRVAMPRVAHYAASKSGLNGFIRAAAMEYAPDRITVNGVEPGLILTEAMSQLATTPAEMEAMTAAIPLKRFGSPEEIAFAMLYLASDEASFVTGQTIIVDGGALIPENGAVN